MRWFIIILKHSNLLCFNLVINDQTFREENGNFLLEIR